MLAHLIEDVTNQVERTRALTEKHRRTPILARTLT